MSHPRDLNAADAGGYEFGPGSATEINRACDEFWERRGTVDPARRGFFYGRHSTASPPVSVPPVAAELPATHAEPEPDMPPAPDPLPAPPPPAAEPEAPASAEDTEPPDLPAAIAALQAALLDYAYAKARTRKRVRTPEDAADVAANILNRLNLPAELRL